MRASRPTAPAGEASSGLISISAISGWAAATRESAAAASAAARTSTGARPRAPVSTPAPRSGAETGLELVGRRRRERDPDVAEQLGVDAAEADEDERAEARVAAAADDQLDAARRVDEPSRPSIPREPAARACPQPPRRPLRRRRGRARRRPRPTCGAARAPSARPGSRARRRRPAQRRPSRRGGRRERHARSREQLARLEVAGAVDGWCGVARLGDARAAALAVLDEMRRACRRPPRCRGTPERRLPAAPGREARPSTWPARGAGVRSRPPRGRSRAPTSVSRALKRSFIWL